MELSTEWGQRRAVCDPVCVPARITALTSELGLCLELDDQPAVLADVDADDLQPGREHAVRLDPCKDSTPGSPHSTLAPQPGSASPTGVWDISKGRVWLGSSCRAPATRFLPYPTAA